MTIKPSVLYKEFSTGCSVQGTQTYLPSLTLPPQTFLTVQAQPQTVQF